MGNKFDAFPDAIAFEERAGEAQDSTYTLGAREECAF